MNTPKKVECFFQSGSQKSQSKGLLVVVLELGFKVSLNSTLDELKSILPGHKTYVFNISSHLITVLLISVLADFEIRKISKSLLY